MEKGYIVYKKTDSGQFIIGTLPTAKCEFASEYPGAEGRLFQYSPIYIEESSFEKEFFVKRKSFEQQMSQLHHIREQRQLLTFTVVRAKPRLLTLSHKDYPDCSFYLYISHYPLENFKDIYPGQSYQFFIHDASVSPVQLSFYYPQDHPEEKQEILPVSTEPIEMEIRQVSADRIVFFHEGTYYTVPSHSLFYANTPLGMDYYEQLPDRKMSLYVIEKNRFGFYHLTDKCIPFDSCQKPDAASLPVIGSLVTGMPVHYIENFGIFVKTDSFIGLIPRSMFRQVSWQSVPEHFPLGVGQQFEVAYVTEDKKGMRVILKPMDTVAEATDSSSKIVLLKDGETYPVMFVRCQKSEDGKEVRYLTGMCKSEVCRLYSSFVPRKLQPLLEEMASQNCVIQLRIYRKNNYYICTWPSSDPSQTASLMGTHSFKVLCKVNKLALLTMNGWLSVHQFRIWELWKMCRSKVNTGDVVSMLVKGVHRSGLLQVGIDDQNDWERCPWKVGDTLEPLGRGVDNEMQVCNCHGVPGILLPLGSVYEMGKTVTVVFVDKVRHILVVTLEPDLFKLGDLQEGKTVVGTALKHLEGPLMTAKTGNKILTVVEDLNTSKLLSFYTSRKKAFNNACPGFVINTIEGSDYVYAKWNGMIGNEDYADMAKGKGVTITLNEKTDKDKWLVSYQHISGTYPVVETEGTQDTSREIVAFWNGRMTPDGELFEFVPLEQARAIVPVPHIDVGTVITIIRHDDERWYYGDYPVIIDWGKPLFPTIDNAVIASSLLSLDVMVVSNVRVLKVDGREGLQRRHDLFYWDGKGVLADMYAVGVTDNQSLVLSGNMGAGLLPLSAFSPEVSPQIASDWCSQRKRIRVTMESRNSSGLMSLVPAPQASEPAWEGCPVEEGDILTAEVMDIQKGTMNVRWQFSDIGVRRSDAVPQRPCRPADIYKVGQWVGFFVKKVVHDKMCYYLKAIHNHDEIRRKIDFHAGDLVEVSVVRTDDQGVIVMRNGVYGVVVLHALTNIQFVPNQTITVRCQSVDEETLDIAFDYDVTDVPPMQIECVVSSVVHNERIMVKYEGEILSMDTRRIPAYAFVAGDRVTGLLRQSGGYSLELDGFRKSRSLKGEIVSGTVLSSDYRNLVLEFDDGTRGIMFVNSKKMAKKIRKNYKPIPKGTRMDDIRCIWVNHEMGIARFTTDHSELSEKYTGLAVGDEVTFTLERIDHDALHGYVDSLYAMVRRQEAGWKYGISDDFSLEANFTTNSQLNAHIVAIGNRLELSLKCSLEERSVAWQVGNIIKGRIVRFVLCPEDWRRSYYLLEWDDFVGILPLRESSYQAYPPLLYFTGEEVTAIITEDNSHEDIPILSVCRCQTNPFKKNTLKVGDCCQARLLGIYSGNLIISLSGGIRTCLSMKNCCSTRSQYEELIARHDIMVRIKDIQGKKYVVEPLQSYPMGTSLLRGTRIQVTIFQIETFQMEIRGYDAFSDDGLLVWIPARKNANSKDQRTTTQDEICVGDRFVARLTSNPGDMLVKAMIIMPLN